MRIITLWLLLALALPAFGAGEKIVRSHDAARTATSNTTAAQVLYDTATHTDSIFTWSAGTAVVDDTARYLAIYDIGMVDTASSRAVGTLVPEVNAANVWDGYKATHRYLRNSGGTEGASIGMAMLSLSATDAVRVRVPGVISGTDALGNYATRVNFGGALQLVKLPDGDFTEVRRTSSAAEVGTSNINATRPWLDSSGTWTKITYNSEPDDDGGLYPGSGGDLTLEANEKYMIVWGASISSTDTSRHTHVVRLSVDGENVQSGSGYQRTTGSQGPPIVSMYLHETDGTADTVFLEATHETEGGDAGTPTVQRAYIQVLKLPSSAEWIHADNGAADSMTTALTSITGWSTTPLSATQRTDAGGDLSLDAANDAIQNDSGGTLPVLAVGWHRWDRDSGASGVRKMPWTTFLNGATRLGYGIGGAYSRGQQGTDDTFQAHYTSAAITELAASADLKFEAQDPASVSNADMGIYASTNRNFLGVQVLNLNSLDVAVVTKKRVFIIN